RGGAAQPLRGGRLVTGPPKTEAGIRRVTVPSAVLSELTDHIRSLEDDPDSLVFSQPGGQPIVRMTYYRAWRRATAALGLAHLRPHDLRHTGNTLAASTGASTRELMARMGHASPRAARIYQHATREREGAIARALDALIQGGPGSGLRRSARPSPSAAQGRAGLQLRDEVQVEGPGLG
ncbi:MAG: tyrosine-type recombinase/integrase, partial [Acidimicrobiales bacterium]